MPRLKDPIWDKYDCEYSPSSTRIYAKCKECNWRHNAKVERLRSHYATHTEVENEEHPLTSGSEAIATTTPVMPKETSRSNGTPSSPKVEELENSLKVFRAEFDVKMKIIEQILTTKHNEFKVQKQLIEREETLYESLLEHWHNAPDLANQGLSIHFDFTSVPVDANSYDDPEEILDHNKQPESPIGSRSGRKRRRRKRLTSDFETSSTQWVGETEEDKEEDVDQGDTDIEMVDDANDVEYVPPPGYLDNDTEGERTRNRRSKKTMYYEKDRRFDSVEEAQQFVRSEKEWRMKQKTRTMGGSKWYYTCKYDRRCPSRVYISDEQETTGDIRLYKSPFPHDHKVRPNYGMSYLVQEKIKSFMDMNIIAPSLILRKLKEVGCPRPKFAQLNNFIASERERRLSKRNRSPSGQALTSNIKQDSSNTSMIMMTSGLPPTDSFTENRQDITPHAADTFSGGVTEPEYVEVPPYPPDFSTCEPMIDFVKYDPTVG